MNDKKSKVNIVLIILLIFAIIFICGMAGYIYKLSNDKKIATTESEKLNTEIENLKNKNDELQEKIDNVSDVVNSNKTQENDSSKLNDEEAMNMLKKNFENLEKIYLEPDKFFEVKSDSEISNFTETLLKYGTEKFVKEIKNNLPWVVEMRNNKYYITNGGGAREYNGLDGFEDIKVSESAITATVKTKQTGPDSSGNWIDKEDKKSQIKLVKEGENWLIDEFNISDFN